MRKVLQAQDYYDGIVAKDLSILSRAITLVESKKSEHIEMGQALIKLILPLTGRAKRIGISGTPGVGKSTFLENFGMHLINQGYKVAVLAVDPTSQVTGGSILGDKTRMQYLSRSEDAFIRPSPNGPTLGGIAAKTRESMLLCDAFGFDFIFIETVGVGQSEISVSNLVDFFMLLMQPGSGDELQGIKRGILEVSDLVIVNKADGEQEKVSKIAQHDYQSSLKILQDKRTWETKVLRCSSLYKKGFDDIQKALLDFYLYLSDENLLQSKRDEQMSIWVKDLVKEKVELLMKEDSFVDTFNGELAAVKAGQKGALQIVDKLVSQLLK